MNAGLDWWPTVISLLSYSVILTYAFVWSGGSVLLVALVHAGLNGVAPLMAGLEVDRTWIIRALVAASIAIAVVVIGGVRRPRRARPPIRSSDDRDARRPGEPARPELCSSRPAPLRERHPRPSNRRRIPPRRVPMTPIRRHGR